jgi:hypothetical protein
MAPLALTDAQLALVLTTGQGIPPEKHSVFLERVAAQLQNYRHINDTDVERAIRRAIQGLVHAPAA